MVWPLDSPSSLCLYLEGRELCAEAEDISSLSLTKLQPSVLSAAHSPKLQQKSTVVVYRLQLSITICALQLPQLRILIIYDTHVLCPELVWRVVCVRIQYAAMHLAGPLAKIRPAGGPSALDASCTPQHQQFTIHLWAFMRVSSNSTPALQPCNSGFLQPEVGAGGLEECFSQWWNGKQEKRFSSTLFL